MTLELLVEQFAQHVAAQTEAIWRGDAKTGNKLLPSTQGDAEPGRIERTC